MPELEDLMCDISQLRAQFDYWAENYAMQNHGGINPWFIWDYVLHLNYDSVLSNEYSYLARAHGWPINQAS